MLCNIFETLYAKRLKQQQKLIQERQFVVRNERDTIEKYELKLK